MHDETGAQDFGFFAALRVRSFAFVWLSSMLSGSGQWTLTVARGWLMLKLTGSAGWVGVTIFAAWIPYLFATPIGGILAVATVLLTFTATGEVFVMTAVCYAAAMALIWRSGARPLPVRVLGNPLRE